MLKDVSAILRARAVVWIRTREEVRAERSIMGLCKSLKMEPRIWRLAKGIMDADGKILDARAADPNTLLRSLPDDSGRRLYIIEAIGEAIANNPMSRALFRELVRTLPTLPTENGKGVVVIDTAPMPDWLKGLAYEVEFSMPDREMMFEIVDSISVSLGKEMKKSVEGAKDDIVKSLLGLEAEEAAVALKRCLTSANGSEPDFRSLLLAKKTRMKDGSLEWHDPDPRGLDAIGGLDNLKAWLTRRRRAFEPSAREWGLPSPKGILILGIPGSGKSLSCKAVGAFYKMPLLRWDIGAVFGKFVGDSEANMRDAIKTAKAMAPCIVWLDEIEKALAGSGGSGDGDSGTTVRVFGNLLTFLQESEGIFTIATANDISKLPPELLRAGRFDCIWWVDLPSTKERFSIIDVMRKKFPRCSDVDPNPICEASEGYTGAEIEQGFVAALNAAFSGDREPTTQDVVEGLNEVIPVARQNADKLEESRRWARSGAKLASLPDSEEKSQFGGLEL